MRWNFVLHSLRRLLFPLRPKLTHYARSDKGLRGNAMLAHESANASLARSWYAMQENSNASAYSVGPPRNFCFTDYSTIMNNAARTILTKVCKNRLFQISFWLCFVFWQSECLTVAIIFIGSTRDKNHASTRYWFKPLTIACHRIPEKNGHIKVITSAHATLTCPFSPGMG